MLNPDEGTPHYFVERDGWRSAVRVENATTSCLPTLYEQGWGSH